MPGPSNIKKAMEMVNRSSPPFQPSISMNVQDYSERLIDWNILSAKKGVLCYQFKTGTDIDACTIDVLPDACLNALFECNTYSPHSLFSGFFFKPKRLHLKPGTVYFGFKPYSSLGIKIKNVSLSDLSDSHVDFTTVFPNSRKFIENIASAGSFEKRISLFTEFSNTDIIDLDYEPAFADYITLIICSSQGNLLFDSLQRILGYSERYIRGKFRDIYGFPPKRYSKVMRFQNILKKLLCGNYCDLSSLAVEAGYFDQSHFIHEFNQFVESPPEKYRKKFTKYLEKTALRKPG
jgi:AraC-like DNA-binding protein